MRAVKEVKNRDTERERERNDEQLQSDIYGIDCNVKNEYGKETMTKWYACDKEKEES